MFVHCSEPDVPARARRRSSDDRERVIDKDMTKLIAIVLQPAGLQRALLDTGYLARRRRPDAVRCLCTPGPAPPPTSPLCARAALTTITRIRPQRKKCRVFHCSLVDALLHSSRVPSVPTPGPPWAAWGRHNCAGLAMAANQHISRLPNLPCIHAVTLHRADTFCRVANGSRRVAQITTS
ncbi:hypothetical protein OH76DRAFT_584260 [Lentinus brumalis]|uniref:Uncharacterized protein n=1 Tax=Lentinus brumalis TaxID=2498619 RepID=A0A371DTS8_9APHY|nr:hypothetical protein OH76DRAFT_584260 [Polyporus brumalis]